MTVSLMRFVSFQRLMSDTVSKVGELIPRGSKTDVYRYIITKFGSRQQQHHSASPSHAPQLATIFPMPLY